MICVCVCVFFLHRNSTIHHFSNILYIYIVLNINAVANKEDELSLINRAKATLRGEDAVIQLLYNRMRDVFQFLVIQNSQLGQQQVPETMRSGRAASSSSRSNVNDSSFDVKFKKMAREEFVKKGFVFYSDDLTEASLLAYKTINLVLNTYGDSILDKIFATICSE